MHFLPEEEQKLITKCALLPYVILVFQQDIRIIEQSNMKVKEPYLQFVRQAIKGAEQERSEARKMLRAKGVHVYREQRSDAGVEIRYAYKGYHHQSQFKWDYVKSHLIRFMDDSLCKGISLLQRDSTC